MSEPAVQWMNPRSKPGKAPPGPRRAINRASSLTQAFDLKDEAYKAGTDKDTPVHVKAALMRAWVDLQEIVMALRGQGKPKPVEARNAQPKRKARAALRPLQPSSASDTSKSESVAPPADSTPPA